MNNPVKSPTPTGAIVVAPSYAELVELLESAPTREVVVEDRYWEFRRRVDAVLQRIDAARDAAAKSP